MPVWLIGKTGDNRRRVRLQEGFGKVQEAVKEVAGRVLAGGFDPRSNEFNRQ
jgi:hypothetical protein